RSVPGVGATDKRIHWQQQLPVLRLGRDIFVVWEPLPIHLAVQLGQKGSSDGRHAVRPVPVVYRDSGNGSDEGRRQGVRTTPNHAESVRAHAETSTAATRMASSRPLFFGYGTSVTSERSRERATSWRETGFSCFRGGPSSYSVVERALV